MADESYADHRQDTSPLFSMEAADNAEVVPTHVPHGPESMWTTVANPDVVEEVGGAGASHTTPGPGGGIGAAGPVPPPYVAEDQNPTSGAGPDHGGYAYAGDEGRGHADAGSPTDDDDAAWFSMGSVRPPEGAAPSAPRPSAPRPSAPRPSTPRPSTPRPSTPRPSTPRPSTPPPSGFGFGAPPNGWSRSEDPPTPVGAPGAGGVFSAEPVERVSDVVDEDDGEEFYGELAHDDWSSSGPNDSVFSSGAGGRTAPNGAVHHGRSGGGASGPAPRPPITSARNSGNPFGGPVDPWTELHRVPEDTVRRVTGPSGPEPDTRSGPRSFSAPQESPRAQSDPTTAVAADQYGFDVAISRLRDDDQERARVPLAVCGALLEPGEQVIGVVTGQMLGRPAAVVATRERVLVVNDRRWEPIVDVYRIDGSLLVRGRHDRHVAALSFADDQRLSMVDGITEVELAIDLADAIRDPGGADHGSGTAF